MCDNPETWHGSAYYLIVSWWSNQNIHSANRRQKSTRPGFYCKRQEQRLRSLDDLQSENLRRIWRMKSCVTDRCLKRQHLGWLTHSLAHQLLSSTESVRPRPQRKSSVRIRLPAGETRLAWVEWRLAWRPWRAPDDGTRTRECKTRSDRKSRFDRGWSIQGEARTKNVKTV